MNKSEYYNRKDKYSNNYYKQIQKLLKDWKFKNNIAERCIVHHRDDTEECREYNDTHYELWGFEIDENGNLKFELGRYVRFMTHSEHMQYHCTGRKLSDATKEKIGIAHKGKYVSDETRTKLSAASKGEKNGMYGKHHTEAAKEKISVINKEKMKGANRGDKNPFYGKTHDEKTLTRISEKMTAHMHIIREAYNQYKASGGLLKWNDFRKEFAKSV